MRINNALRSLRRTFEMTRESRGATLGMLFLRTAIALWDAVLYSVVLVALAGLIKGGGGGEGLLTRAAVYLGLSPQDAPVLGIMGALTALIMRDILDMLALVCETRYLVSAATKLRVKLLGNFYGANQAFLDDNKSSDRYQVLVREARDVIQAMIFFFQVVGYTANLVVIFVMMLMMNSPLTAVLAACLLPIGLFKYFYTIYLKRISDRSLETRTDFWRKMKDYASGIKQIKLAGRFRRVRQTFVSAAYDSEYMMQKEKLMRRWETPVIEIMGLFIIGLIIMVSRTGLVSPAPVMLSTIIGFLVLLNRLIPVLSRLGVSASAMIQSFVAVEYVYRFFRLPARYREQQEGLDKTPFLERSIRLEQVSLDYGDRSRALDRVNLVVHKGEKIGIVGPSGAGKSSLVHLLLGLYQPSQGRILVDEVELSQIAKACLWRNIGLVSQDIYLFDLTIREVICFAADQCSPEAVEDAARRANLARFVAGLPQGYETVVGEKGAKLSGGERQRLIISQILLKDPALIILDEATSALDSATEQEIMRTIEAVSRDKTIIMIAHRLATLKGVDRIYVLDQGAVKEEGAWEELLAKQGLFWELVQHQRMSRQGQPD
ncbi:MAG: ABC transporter ATP-binding protein [Thermodesulfobacteriota bacterium]